VSLSFAPWRVDAFAYAAMTWKNSACRFPAARVAGCRAGCRAHDHPVLSASMCGQAVAIKEICAESLRMGHEFQRGRVLYRWSCSPTPVTKLSQSHRNLAIDMDSHRKFS